LIHLKEIKHGGARKGAGRPKKRETKTVRVPLHLVDEVRRLIKEKDTGL
jgi:hypothetical protein